jgi:hypothetical protein
MKTPAGLCAIVLLAFVGVGAVVRAQLQTIQQEARTIVANALAGAMR